MGMHGFTFFDFALKYSGEGYILEKLNNNV